MKGMAETAEDKWLGECEEYMCLLRCHSNSWITVLTCSAAPDLKGYDLN